MPKTDRFRRAGRAAASLAVVALVASALVPATTRAHAVLVDATPAPGEVVLAGPPRLELVFSEPIDRAALRVRVLAGDSEALEGLGSVQTDDTGLIVSADLPALDPGTYTVEYTVVSAVDGHPTASAYAFVVDPSGRETAPPPPTPGPETPSDPFLIVTRGLATLAALLLVGLALAWLLYPGWIRVSTPGFPRAAAVGFSAVALMTLVAHLGRAATLVAQTTGQAPPEGFFLDPAAAFGSTPYAWAMRLAVLGSAAAAVLAILTARWQRGAAVGMGIAALAILGGLSLTGHAAALGGLVGAAFALLHLAGIAAWLATLPALALLAWKSTRDGTPLRELTGRALGAHARVAFVAAPLVILSGLANSRFVVDPSREFAAADYGNLVLAKAALVSVALGLGAANFLLARRQPGRRLATFAGIEVLIGLTAVAVGSTMVGIPPAADRPPAAIEQRLAVAHLYGASGDVQIHGIVDLPEPGIETYSVGVADAATGAGRTDVVQVVFVFHPPPDSGLPLDAQLAQPTVVPWVWSLRGAHTPLTGTWQFDVSVQLADRSSARVVLPLAIRPAQHPLTLPPPASGGETLGMLAAPSRILPSGPGGWIVVIAALGVAAALLAVERRQRRQTFRAVRLVLIGLVVVFGVSLTARDVLAVANRAPPEWRDAENPVANSDEAVAAGEALYHANCSSCHGMTGAGDGPATAGLGTQPADLAVVVPHRSDGELAWALGAGVVGTPMPAFGTTLLDSERWELVAYLRAQWPDIAE